MTCLLSSSETEGKKLKTKEKKKSHGFPRRRQYCMATAPVFYRIPITKDLRYIHRAINSVTMFAIDPALEQFHIDDQLPPMLPETDALIRMVMFIITRPECPSHVHPFTDIPNTFSYLKLFLHPYT